jgi:hypothetical protein
MLTILINLQLFFIVHLISSNVISNFISQIIVTVILTTIINQLHMVLII